MMTQQAIAKLTDREIVHAILSRDTLITKEYLYRKCYPLFAAIHSRYYTDCQSPVELINEIYLYILIPRGQTRRSKLQDFGFRCSLPMWLKIVTENYCHQLYARRLPEDANNDIGDDRNLPADESIKQNMRNLNMTDLHNLLSMMPNQRYKQLIEYRYVDEKTNEETALLLAVTMANYYNMHKRAKAQFCEVLRREGLV